MSHDDLDDDGIPDTKCLKGHPADHDSIDERSFIGCIDYDKQGATFPQSQIDEDIAYVKSKYSAESVHAALAVMGEFLFKKHSGRVVGCAACAGVTADTAVANYCSSCGRLLVMVTPLGV